jgi:hypothetical protein
MRHPPIKGMKHAPHQKGKQDQARNDSQIWQEERNQGLLRKRKQGNHQRSAWQEEAREEVRRSRAACEHLQWTEWAWLFVITFPPFLMNEED